MLICAIQVINGLLGTLCGDCQCCGCCRVSWGFRPFFSAGRRPDQATHTNGDEGQRGGGCRKPELGWKVQGAP